MYISLGGDLMFKFIKNESGQSMVFVALMFTVLIGFSSLAIGVGYMTYQEGKLQNAADSAALAGALLAPELTTTEVQTQIVSYAKANDNTLNDSDIIKKEVSKTYKTVEVQIKQIVPKFLGGIFSSKDRWITVTAKAKYNAWPGYALPFINIDDPYLEPVDVDDPDYDEENPYKYITIHLWEKEKSGNFEVIIGEYDPVEDSYLVIEDEQATIDSGRVMQLKQTLTPVVESAMSNNKAVYVLSLKNDSTGLYSKSELEDMFTKVQGKIKAPINDLVLLKGYITGYDLSNANDPVITIDIVEAFEYDEVYNEIIMDEDKKISSYLIN